MIDVQIKDKNMIELDLSGEITGEDYKRVEPQLEKVFKENGKQKFLFDLTAARNFTAGAVFQDIKIDLKNFKYIGTTAIVSTKAMTEKITKFMDKIYPVRIEHFENKEAALQWLSQQQA